MIEIDLNSWERKSQYNFFKDFDDPFFGATSNIECTKLYVKSKHQKESFFVHYIHKAFAAINEIQEFKLRIVDDKVVVFPKINGTTTVFKADKTFNFCYFNFHEDFKTFRQQITKALNDAKNSNELESKSMLDLVYVSVIPWRSFTCIKHPQNLKNSNSVPKIVFGKVFQENEKYFMPVSVEAHHALLDGYHISCFFNRFEELLAME